MRFYYKNQDGTAYWSVKEPLVDITEEGQVVLKEGLIEITEEEFNEHQNKKED